MVTGLTPLATESPKKVAAMKEVAVTKVELDGMTTAIPDKREDYTMDQDLWCAGWQDLVVSLPNSSPFA